MRESLWTKNFVLIIISNLFLFLALEMLLPTLPIYVAEKGGSDLQVGLIIGLFSFSAVLARPFVGLLTAKFGKKVLLLLGVAVCLIGTVSYFAAATIILMMLLRIVHGIGFGVSTTLYGTVVSDIVPASRRGEGLGFFGTGNAIAISLGPFLGIWLMEQFGYSHLFIGGGAILFIAIIFTSFVKEKRAEQLLEDQKPSKDQPLMLRFIEPTALLPSALGLLIGFAFGGIVGFITLFGKETGIQNISYFFLCLAVSEFLIRFISGRIYDTRGRFWVLVPAALLCMISCVLLFMTNSMWMLLLVGFLYGAGFGAIFPALQAWVIDRVEPGRRGVATATYYNAFDIGIGSGAVLLGFVATWTNYATMYLASGLLYVVFLGVYGMYEYKKRRLTPMKGLERAARG